MLYNNGKFKTYPLNDSAYLDKIIFPKIIGKSDELIFCSGIKIYRYSQQLKQFYLLKVAGDFGFIWSAFIINNKLILNLPEKRQKIEKPYGSFRFRKLSPF